MNNLPNLSDLKVFCTVAKLKSFVESAEELGTSPAFISKRINILENTLSCKLFHRSTRHVSLTEDGKIKVNTPHKAQIELAQLSRELRR